MKITNRLNLPLPIVRAIANSGYSPGESDITATGLIEPTQIGALKAKHRDDISEDAADMIYSLQGQSVHTILERAGAELEKEGFIVEKRLYGQFGTWKVGAQIDVFDSKAGILQDYKITSVYGVKDGPKEDYVKQLNIGAELLRRNGYVVKKLQIVAILRDWSKGEYQRELTRCEGLDVLCRYPAQQVVVLDVPMIPTDEVVTWIGERVIAHQDAREAAAKGLPLTPCTDEERWARPKKWAVMEKGKKRAIKLYNDVQSATIASQDNKKLYIEERPGEAIRCASYCPVSKYCKQFNKAEQDD